MESGVVVRDVSGCLGFFVSSDLDAAMIEDITHLIRNELGYYARPDRLIVNASAPGAKRILEADSVLTIEVRLDGGSLWIRYIDRRIVGADWLRRPPASHPSLPPEEPVRAQRVVFCSLKGGVGRSTALSVVAAEQARRGRNVLVVDLDLEAPGIGSLLLSDERTPKFGAVDYLVERNFWTTPQGSEHVHPDREDLVRTMVGTCSLTSGAGLVDVVPAIGTRTLEEPGNYLAKLSRAMIEGLAVTGDPASLATKLSDMLADLERQRRYDLVFIDVRAGLAELAAGPLLALGAEVLIFGTAQPQTIQDLRFLFAHLATLTGERGSSPWIKLKMVHAKATQAPMAARFRDELWDLFASYLYEESLGLDDFNFDANAPEAPHFPLVIPLDTAFADWDPVRNPGNLLENYYSRTFDELIRYIDDLLIEGENDDEK